MLSRPLSGFAETFSWMIAELQPGGGSERPETDPAAEAALFVVDGEVSLSFAGNTHTLSTGGFAYLPPGLDWSLKNLSAAPARFHWIRKAYVQVSGIEIPKAFVASDKNVAPQAMPNTSGEWSTTRFVDPEDIRHDMQVTIVSFEPGAVIPFMETHVMEHGLYVLQGKAVYRLNEDWVEVEAGDYMWLRAFCPQACYAGGPGAFRYLLYKDVHRLPALAPGAR